MAGESARTRHLHVLVRSFTLPPLTVTLRARRRCTVCGTPCKTWQALVAKMSRSSSGMAYGLQKLHAGYVLSHLLVLLAVLSDLFHPAQQFCLQLLALLYTL